MEDIIFELKCKNCGNIVYYYPSKKGDQYQKCENCGTMIIMSTETRIERVLSLDDFELVGIRRGYPQRVLDEDLERIKEIYEKANDKIKEKILTIIDLLYLILNRNDEKALNCVTDKLTVLFDSIVEDNNEYFSKIIESEKEDKNNG